MKTLKITFFIVFVCSVLFIRAQGPSVTLAGHWTDGPCNCVFINNTAVFAGNGSAVDILFSPFMHPYKERILAHGLVNQIIVKDSLAYILSGENGFGIYTDLYGPTTQELYFTQIGQSLNRMCLVKNFVFITSDSLGLLVFNVANPSVPQLLGQYNMDGPTESIAMKGDFLYIGKKYNNILIYDASKPDSLLTLLNSFELYDDYAYRMFVRHNYLYIASQSSTTGLFAQGSFYILNITKSEQPELESSLPIYGDWYSAGMSVCANDSLAFVGYRTDVGNGVMVVDIWDSENPRKIGFLQTENPHSVNLQYNTLYLADGYNGLLGYDISDIDSVEINYHHNTNGQAKTVFVQDGFAYIASGRAGLNVADISNPQETFSQACFNNPQRYWASVNDVFVSGDYAYLAASGGNGLHILNISDLKNIQEVSWLSGFEGGKLDLYGDYAFIANTYNGFCIVDVHDPENPNIIYITPSSYEKGVNIFAQDSLLFLATSKHGLKIFNINDLFKPQQIAVLDSGSLVTAIDVKDEYLFLTEGSAGLHVYNIASLQNPVKIDSIIGQGYLSDVKVKDELVYVTDFDFGLRVYNVSRPDSIYELSNFPTEDHARGLFLDQQKIYVADGNDGLYIFNQKVTSLESPKHRPENFLLSQNYPNPFNSETIIEYRVETRYASSLHVELTMYNVLGQKMRTLVNQRQKPGTYRVRFIGEGFPAGIYFYRLRVRDKGRSFTQSKRMLLLK